MKKKPYQTKEKTVTFHSICITAILFTIPIRIIASDIAMNNHDTIYKPGNIFIFEAKVDSVSKNINHS